MKYFFASFLVRIFSLLPFWMLYLISDFAYFLVYHVAKYRIGVVRENLKRSFPEKSAIELIKIEKEFYHHFCDIFLESLKQPGMSKTMMKRRMKFVNYEPMLRHYDEGRSVMLLTSHYANWEWTSSFSLYLPEDKPAYQIYKRQTDATSDRIIDDIRKHFGSKNVEMKNILRQMITMRGEGKLGMFGMLSDQSPSRNSMHYFTNFLKQYTAVITGTEQLARKFNYPVYYVRMKKIKRGYYTCHFLPIAINPAETAEFEISEKYMRMLEDDIEQNPAYWLWTHKRWKYTRTN